MASTLKIPNATLILGLSLMLVGCDNPDEKVLATVTAWNQVGDSPDHWLEKSDENGWNRVALIFGYYDDFEQCTKVAKALTQTVPDTGYRCVPAN